MACGVSVTHVGYCWSAGGIASKIGQ
jgi:hypothetical protein